MGLFVDRNDFLLAPKFMKVFFFTNFYYYLGKLDMFSLKNYFFCISTVLLTVYAQFPRNM